MRDRATCPECGRVFDLTDEVQAEEYNFGHDCEEVSYGWWGIMPDTAKGKRLEAEAVRAAAQRLLDQAAALDDAAKRQEEED